MFQVPGPPPTPPAMVMVITHQPPSPLWNGWVLGRGGGHPTRTNRNATGRIRWRKLVSSKKSMYVEISYKTVSQDQILKARSNTITEGKVRYVVICLGYKKNSGNPPTPVDWVDPVGRGRVIQSPTNSNATSRVRWYKLIVGNINLEHVSWEN